MEDMGIKGWVTAAGIPFQGSWRFWICRAGRDIQGSISVRTGFHLTRNNFLQAFTLSGSKRLP